MTAAVTLEGLGKHYSTLWAVRGVDLTVGEGERLALLGHNGAGKTTLMKLMLGLIQPDEGRITVLGAPPGDAASPTRRKLGFLPENVALHDALTGRETLDFYARLKGRPARECRTLLERVGLADAAGRRVNTYSKGMRQRLGLAQALLGPPRLLLLDEPTTGLDPALREVFYDIIRGLAAEGTTVLLSSHLLTELEERTDRIAIMDGGRLIASGTLEQLRERAGLPVTLRLTVPAHHQADVIAGLAPWTPIAEPDNRLLCSCPPAEKMAILRQALALGPAVADAQIIEPGLDQIYATFTGRPAEAAQ
jgi:Cu-processing system ATP-binding protein